MRKKVKLRKHLANDDYHTLGLARCSPLAFEAPERDRYATYGTAVQRTCIFNPLLTLRLDASPDHSRVLFFLPPKKITRSRNVRYLASTSSYVFSVRSVLALEKEREREGESEEKKRKREREGRKKGEREEEGKDDRIPRKIGPIVAKTTLIHRGRWSSLHAININAACSVV